MKFPWFLKEAGLLTLPTVLLGRREDVRASVELDSQISTQSQSKSVSTQGGRPGRGWVGVSVGMFYTTRGSPVVLISES